MGWFTCRWCRSVFYSSSRAGFCSTRHRVYHWRAFGSFPVIVSFSSRPGFFLVYHVDTLASIEVPMFDSPVAVRDFIGDNFYKLVTPSLF